jgi:hypothetical protein
MEENWNQFRTLPINLRCRRWKYTLLEVLPTAKARSSEALLCNVRQQL